MKEKKLKALVFSSLEEDLWPEKSNHQSEEITNVSKESPLIVTD